MGFTVRDLTPEDAAATAALMRRIEADHPTGFCLGEVEILEIMRDKPDSVWEGAFEGPDLVAYTALMPGPPLAAGQKVFLFGDVDPIRTGEGLGTLMLPRSMERARAIHAAVAPEVPLRFAGAALAGRADQADLMAASGLSPGRHSFLMVADVVDAVPAPGLPGDVWVEPFDPATGEELRIAHNIAFADYPDGSETGADFWTMFMVTPAHARHHLSVVARDGRGVVAAYVFAHEYAVPPSGGPGPELHIPYLGTLPEHRGRGLATGLLGRVLLLARQAGHATVSLNVDTDNPTGALGIYERAGFRAVYRQDFYLRDE